MANGYYTPALEDLKAGYECEVNVGKKVASWQKTVINQGTVIKDASIYRTAFLTKEFFKAGGWVDRGEHAGNVLVLQKDDLLLDYYLDTRLLAISQLIKVDDYTGLRCKCNDAKCPSINEFKLIRKLLGI